MMWERQQDDEEKELGKKNMKIVFTLFTLYQVFTALKDTGIKNL